MQPDALAALARSVAAAYRLGMLGQGGEALVRFVDELTAHLDRERTRATALAPQLAPLLEAIVAAQERGDPIGLADRIEHELVPALLAR